MFLAYPFLGLLSVVLAGLTWLLAPLLAKTVQPDGNLPRRLRWFQTFDATCFEGRQPQYGMTGTDQEVAEGWLRRNPGYGFDYWPLGCKFDPVAWRVLRYQVDEAGNVSFFAVGPGGRFNWTGKRGWLRWKLGWKAWNMYDAVTGGWKSTPFGPDWRIPICCTLSK